MKAMSNNWLGFSLSPQMNMEVSSDPPHHHHQHHQHHQHHHHLHGPPSSSPSSSLPCSFFLSPPPPPPPTMCYGVEGDNNNNGALYSQLPIMPLKSDGSLCIMEAFHRSQHQGMVPSPSPKLEDFLGCGGGGGGGGGGGNGGVPTPTNEGEAMGLSLDNTTMYYNQNMESESNRNHPLNLNLLQLHYRQHNPYFQPLEESMLMYNTPLDYGNAHNNNNNNGLVEGGVVYGDLKPLSLSMSPGSQSSCVTAPQEINAPIATTTNTTTTTTTATNDQCIMGLDGASKKRGGGKMGQKQTVHRKSIDTFGQRTSQYRGVTRHRWTGRYEAHLWDNSCKKEGQTRKGRQVYLGGYDMEEKAARAYDLAALKYWGLSTHINFPLESYQEEVEEMKNMSRQEYVAHLRRKSSGFSRGASMYRGVTRHHQHGRWQARIGRVAGNKDLYLGTFSTQEEAAEAYDIAAIKFRGANAVTNFDITRYDVERIMASNTLLPGELARKAKAIESCNEEPSNLNLTDENDHCASDWKMVLYQSAQQEAAAAAAAAAARSSETGEQKPIREPAAIFASPLNGLVDVEIENSRQEIDDSGKLASTHVSNSSSLATSLSCSREGSPERAGFTGFYSNKTPNKFISQNPVSSWIQMPVFAAWTDG